jgi:Mn-containing catalase
MPIKLIAPIYSTFTLDKSDAVYAKEGDEPTTVTIKQARQGEAELRANYFAKLERKWNDDTPGEVTLIQNIGYEELKRLEVWLTMVECNLEDENGKAMFPSKQIAGHPVLAMSKSQFYDTWSKLPSDIADEIHGKVLEVNQLWVGALGEAL